MHAVVFIWGFTAIIGDLVQLPALPLVWNRIFIALLAIYVFLRYKKIKIKTTPRQLAILCGAGVIIAAHWVAFFHAIKISNVSITLVCIASTSFFAALLEPIFFRRKLHIYEIILGTVVVGAIALIFSVNTSYFWGIVTALTAAFLSALFSVLNGKLVLKNQSEVITLYELLGGLTALTIAFIFSGQPLNSILPTGQSDIIYIIILGIICTAYPFLESVKVMRHLSPFTVVLAINMEPVYGILLAYFLLGESENLTPTFYVGASIIIAVLFINAIIRRRLRKKQFEAL